MTGLFTIDSLIALLTLASLEIVLGIDNIVLIVLLTGKLEHSLQPLARRLGLILAMSTRILLLIFLNWMAHLTDPLFAIFSHPVSGRDIILFAGGIFLIAKATMEIHEHFEASEGSSPHVSASGKLGLVLVQIAILDIVFSLDSVITAVGMAQHLAIMIAAILAAVGVMLFFAEVVNTFIKKHPTIQILALAFLLLIGVFLVAESLGKHIERGYIYFAMIFSLFVEALNIRLHRKPGNG
jgi:predicted tellurium resistance membrane protein TerC